MAELITMPKLSDTMEEGGISEWLKKEGDEVETGEPLVAIETDKATIEYASPEDGTLLKILVPQGSAAAIQDPIAVFGKKGEDFSSLLEKKPASTSKTDASQQTPADTSKPAQTSASESPSTSKDSNQRLKVSPLAKKIASTRGVDLSTLIGSGPHGRIIAKDVEAAHAAPSLGKPTSSAAVSPDDKRIPVSMMRKTIAKRLVQGKNEAPHYYLKVSFNVESLLTWRSQLNSVAGVKEGTLAKVSINDLLIHISARALRQHPEINASWQGDAIIEHGAVNIAMAVALPQGLITPVLTHVDQRGARNIAVLSKALVQKAHAGQLTQQDYSDGTFTISNLGMTLVEEFTAIINPPQAAILAVGTIRDEVVVDGTGGFKAQKRMNLTLSCDHRVIDGMMGAKFLTTLVGYLENPLLLLE